MNRFVAFSLLVLVAFTSHTYASVTFKSLPVGKEVESWIEKFEAEALKVINVKTKTVGVYRTGHYYNDKI